MISTSTNLISKLRKKCQSQPGTIALPESRDVRILSAALRLLDEKSFQKVVLIGDKASVLSAFEQHNLDLKDAHLSGLVFSNEAFPHLPEQVAARFTDYLEQKGKPSNAEQVRFQSESALAQAGELLFDGEVDVVIGGAVLTTAEVIRAGITSVGLQKGCRTVSGSFLLNRLFEQEEQTYIFADSGVVVDPKPTQLADLAYSSSETLQKICDIEPKVAFLSFSTGGSADHEKVDKVKEALKLFQERHPEIAADGEMQFDTAIEPSVAVRKMPESKIAGNANVFVFPDLNSGNIGYKIAQRWGGFAAYGPILQGLSKPFSDLSRGASVEDIVASAYINYLRR